MGEFWPEDIDVTMCDVIYYGFGNILNDTYEVKLQLQLLPNLCLEVPTVHSNRQ